MKSLGKPHNDPVMLIEEAGESPVRICICYAAEDAGLYTEFQSHLVSLIYSGLIEIWHVGRILGGDEWETEIVKHIQDAQLILLMISADFLTSRRCIDIALKASLQQRASQHVRVVPILLRPVEWKLPPLRGLQPVPRDGRTITEWRNRDEAWLLVVQEIHAIIKDSPSSAQETYGADSTRLKPSLRMKGGPWLRQIIEQAFPQDPELEAFLLNYFPSLRTGLLRETERTTRLNLLFIAEESMAIFAEFRKARPFSVPFYLLVREGAEQGICYPLPAGRSLLIGRSLQADIQLPNDDLKASRRHASVEARDKAVHIQKLSKNPIFVNDAPIDTTHVLRAGDCVRIRSVLLQLMGSESISTETE